MALTKIENAAWSGLQLPQSGVNTITITIEGKDYVFTHSTDIPLVGGQYTTVNLIVGRNTIDLASVGISNWAAGRRAHVLPAGDQDGNGCQYQYMFLHGG